MKYVYKCNRCNAEQDVDVPIHKLHKFKAPKCKTCRVGTTRRIISYPTPVVYKGEGFTKATKGE